MTISLHAAIIPAYLQGLEALGGLLVKAEVFCSERKLPAQQIIEARLAEDMQPFAYQVKEATVHSWGAIEGVRRGVFSPNDQASPDSFPGLKARVDEALLALRGIDPAEMEGFMGRDMRFSVADRNINVDFRAEDFLLSFSLPNFYFHVTTAYDILRWQGMPIGKRDFLGRLRKKR